MTNVIVSDKIKVGFKHKTCSTDALHRGVVVAMSEKSKIKKSKKFDDSRDVSVDPKSFDNVPTTGFSLDLKSSRAFYDSKSMVLIVDPRGFSVEITTSNLLRMMSYSNWVEGTSSDAFVYAWEGTELVLLSVKDPEYAQFVKAEKAGYVKGKDLVVGGTYKGVDGDELVYLGKKELYDYGWDGVTVSKVSKPKFVFGYVYESNGKSYTMINTYGSITRKLVDVVTTEMSEEFGVFEEKMSTDKKFTPIDHSLTEDVFVTVDEVKTKLKANGFVEVTAENGKVYSIVKGVNDGYAFNGEKSRNEIFTFQTTYHPNSYNYETVDVTTIENILDVLKPTKKVHYLSNGTLYTEKFTK